MSRTWIISGLLSVLALSSYAAESVTKSEYIKKMDAGCQKAQDDLMPLNEENQAAQEKSDFKKVHSILVRAKAITDKVHAEQEKMTRPTQDAAALEHYWSVLKDLVKGSDGWLAKVEELADAPKGEQESAEAALDESTKKQMEHAKALHEAATKYGFKVCGILKMQKAE